ncbi:hypothetical protein H2198_002724 [Neophaeococcomyces mojaviensis]|uniref:Uncharacterized protein n=1 Tax=Neophaeococcomyces mojaviensis TaxID=3383035 RepID=A0ACC3ADG6_9EURO|nr:hypothetical protein H2198_002724 [Knufia sp. JES_112]
MASQAPPSIPPRPVKQQAAAQGVSKLPDVPPRPLPKRVDRSVSPGNFPRSPLNEPYHFAKTGTPDPVARPPSVAHLPTPGEEGIEYANVNYQSPSSVLEQEGAAQTRLVAEDLQLHAPKPSLPKSTATAQVQGVTRTDSAQAVSYGVGRASHDDLTTTRTRSRQSFSRPDSAASGERRRSIVHDEQGPATMGLRVPINPLLGDVQAPSPAGLSPQVTGESPRRHGRKKSGMEDFRPPGSYGLHGHGIVPEDRFEREWYAKHPDQLEHEEGQGHGVYEGIGSGRGSFALSSDELNKIVRDTASRGAGFGEYPPIGLQTTTNNLQGTNEKTKSYPDEQIGYMASETYQRSQQNTPHPEPLSRVQTHEPTVESPLRRTSFPAEDAPTAEIRRNMRAASGGSDRAHNEAHHIDIPNRRYNKITGGEESIAETQEARPYIPRAEEGGERDYSLPILAEDEVAKDVGAEYMHAAVSPKYERRHSQQHDDHGSGTITPTSRPASRPGSIYQLHSASHSLSRFLSHQDERDHMHTPLEDVAEYEPLFTDDDGKKALSTAERFKPRPDALQKRFPSQDIWEDTPNSAMYVAEVSTPDLPSQSDPQQSDKSELKATSTFEPPEAEAARKEEVPEEEKRKLVPKEERLARSKWAPHLRDDMPTKARPALANRFPSQDVWEDTPDSSYLVTTVGSPQIEEEETSPVETKPPVPARPAKSRLGEGASSAQIAPSVPPSVPARPQKKVHAVPSADAQLTDPTTLSKEPSSKDFKRTPSIPDRPKPQVPPRPMKKPGDEELSRVTSGGSANSNETERATKAKPQIPARPAAGNIASLKGNFMNDLNKKLGLGPPKEKEPEPETEAKPLEDARKGRARGPQRRAPAKSPAAEVKATPKFSMFSPVGLWQIDDEGHLSTIHKAAAEEHVESPIAQKDHAPAAEPLPSATNSSMKAGAQPASSASDLATNAASEPADPVSTNADDDENVEGELTRKTTASTISGESLDREDSRATTHMLPASQTTTASDSDNQTEKLEKVATKEAEVKAKDEPIKVRNEQVSAAATNSKNTHPPADNHNSLNDRVPIDQTLDTQAQDATPGEDEPKEPMNEEDIDYGKLEEMTALADGKTTAEEDPQAAISSKKIMD